MKTVILIFQKFPYDNRLYRCHLPVTCQYHETIKNEIYTLFRRLFVPSVIRQSVSVFLFWLLSFSWQESATESKEQTRGLTDSSSVSTQTNTGWIMEVASDVTLGLRGLP